VSTVSRTRLFGSLCGHAFLVNFARIVFAPLVAVFIAQFGVGESTAGLVVTATWVGSALPRVPTGYLMTRFSRVSVVAAAGVVLTVGAFVTAFANSVVTLIGGAAAMGLASGVYFVAGNTFISELFPTRVGRMLGIHGTANQVAAVLAAPVITLVLALGSGYRPFFDLLGIAPGNEWRAVFLGLALVSALLTVATVLVARRADLPRAGTADRDVIGAAKAEWRVICTGLAVLGTVGFAWQGLFNFYELFMESKGMAPAVAKNTLTLVFGAGIPAFVVSGRLADRLPTLPYLLGVSAAFVVLLFVITATSGTLLLLVLTAVLGYTIHSLFPALDTFLLGTLPDHNRASAYSVYSGGMMLAQAPGSWVVGTLVERGVAYTTVFQGLGVAVAVVVAGLLVLHRAGRLPQ
jgi:DHA1 family inner membrane transport protein